MGLIIDIIIVLLIVTFVLQGMKRGIVKTVLMIANIIISAALSSFLSLNISNYIYNTFIRTAIYDKIYESLIDNDLYTVVTSFFGDLPEGIINILDYNNISQSSILSGVTGTTEMMSEDVLELISPVFISIINVFVTIIVFFLFYVIFNIFINIICSFVKIPILSSVNSLIGGAFGLIFAICIVWILIALLSFANQFVSGEDANIIFDGINNSTLATLLSSLNPFSSLF